MHYRLSQHDLPPQAFLLLSPGETRVQMLVDKLFWHTYRTHGALHCKKIHKQVILIASFKTNK